MPQPHQPLRLTLRTLLAYLDDTLQPHEIKTIGQKVAESDAAQELIDRIKKTTRRRRLTTPPQNGPGARFDANVVSEYLDNELPGDEMVEVEKVCLESDAHLAEVASCHQILTLVLGEPALVPPTAKDRMVKLLQGKEAGPRKPTRPSPPSDRPVGEPVASSLWGRLALPAAVVAALAVVGLLLWQLLPPRPNLNLVADANNATTAPARPDEIPPPVAVADKKDKEPEKAVEKKEPEREPEKKEPEKRDTPPAIRPVAGRPAAPSMEREEVGRYIGAEGNYPSILVHRARVDDRDVWQRFGRDKPVSSGESLVCLPGYWSEVDTFGGVRVLLRGHLREFSVDPFQEFLMDSAVVLHKNPDFDAELTLDRGRIFLSNVKDKGPARVRLRFINQVWDLTLRNRGDEVGVDLFKHYTADVDYRAGEEPKAELYLCVLRGEAELRSDAYHTYNVEAPPEPCVFMWDSSSQMSGPHKQGNPALWKKMPPANELSTAMSAALRDLNLRLDNKRPLESALQDSMEKEAREPKLLAMYSLAAIDDVGKLIDFLGDDDRSHVIERDTAIFALRRWISRSAAQGLKLWDPKERTGLLLNKGYAKGEADIVFTLLHNFREEDRRNPETLELMADYLRHKRVAVATLAYWHLLRMAYPVKLPPFNPADSLDDRLKVSAEVHDMIDKKRLPPAPPAFPAKEPGPKGS